jgi:hypothetical protein
MRSPERSEGFGRSDSVAAYLPVMFSDRRADKERNARKSQEGSHAKKLIEANYSMSLVIVISSFNYP